VLFELILDFCSGETLIGVSEFELPPAHADKSRIEMIAKIDILFMVCLFYELILLLDFVTFWPRDQANIE
jgi:hypothetical protein